MAKIEKAEFGTQERVLELLTYGTFILARAVFLLEASSVNAFDVVYAILLCTLVQMIFSVRARKNKYEASSEDLGFENLKLILLWFSVIITGAFSLLLWLKIFKTGVPFQVSCWISMIGVFFCLLLSAARWFYDRRASLEKDFASVLSLFGKLKGALLKKGGG